MRNASLLYLDQKFCSFYLLCRQWIRYCLFAKTFSFRNRFCNRFIPNTLHWWLFCSSCFVALLLEESGRTCLKLEAASGLLLIFWSFQQVLLFFVFFVCVCVCKWLNIPNEAVGFDLSLTWDIKSNTRLLTDFECPTCSTNLKLICLKCILWPDLLQVYWNVG